mgnify:CR=1 FL=1
MLAILKHNFYTIIRFIGCTDNEYGHLPRDYNGTISVTKSGKMCQSWGANTPHRPNYRPQNPSYNFCRNPDNDQKGAWCYTTDPNTRYEYCACT